MVGQSKLRTSGVIAILYTKYPCYSPCSFTKKQNIRKMLSTYFYLMTRMVLRFSDEFFIFWFGVIGSVWVGASVISTTYSLPIAESFERTTGADYISLLSIDSKSTKSSSQIDVSERNSSKVDQGFLRNSSHQFESLFKSGTQKGNAHLGLGQFDQAKECYESLRTLGENSAANTWRSSIKLRKYTYKYIYLCCHKHARNQKFYEL